MGKNVYSLVLLDEVVDAVDRLACEQHASRSGLINRILAEYLSCPIPETRIRDVFSSMERMFSQLDSFQLSARTAESALSFRSVLHYRYRPTVRYIVELYPRLGPWIGELRVCLRTQSEALLDLLEDFFSLWEETENRAVGSRFPGGIIPCEITPGRFTRRLRQPEQKLSGEMQARAIRAYVCALDEAMKSFFADPEQADAAIRQQYGEYLKNNSII